MDPLPQDQKCVGPSSEQAGKADSCAGCPNQATCSSGGGAAALESLKEDSIKISSRMSSIKNKILILSGKGGVGKSTFSSQFALALSNTINKKENKPTEVGLLDLDICGPSIPRMLGLEGYEVHESSQGWSPVYYEDKLAVMSIGFLLPRKDDAIIWRGPRKNNLIKNFLGQVLWEDLDYLVIDTPPGTSDEHISIVQFLKTSGITGAIIITTPQEVSMADVRKEINFCMKTGVKVLGIVENMSDIKLKVQDMENYEDSGIKITNKDGQNVTQQFLDKIKTHCPEFLDCNIESNLFKLPPSLLTNSSSSPTTPQAMAEHYGIPFLGCLSMDPNMMKSCEAGKSFLETYPNSTAAKSFTEIVNKIVNIVDDINANNEDDSMAIDN